MLVDEERERREHQIAHDKCHRRQDDPTASEISESDEDHEHGRQP
jgi:hypothetical protein